MRTKAPTITWSTEPEGNIRMNIPSNCSIYDYISFGVRVTWRGHSLDLYLSRSYRRIDYHLFDGQAVHDFIWPRSSPPVFRQGNFELHLHACHEALYLLERPVGPDHKKPCRCEPPVELPEADKTAAALRHEGFEVRELLPEEKEALYVLTHPPREPEYHAPACWKLRDGLVLYKREDGGRTWEQLVRYEEDKHIVVDSWFLGNSTESEAYASVAPADQPALAAMLGIESVGPLHLMQAILMRFQGNEAFQLFCEALDAHKVPCERRGYDTSKG